MPVKERIILFWCVLCIGLAVQLSYTSVAEAAATVRVGVHEVRPLVIFEEDNRVGGFAIDVLQAVAAAEDWQLVYEKGSFSECMERLRKNEVDLVAAVSLSGKLSREFAVTEVPIIKNWGHIYAHPGRGIRSILDLDGRIVAIRVDDALAEGLEEELRRFDLSARFVKMTEYAQVLQLVDNGLADAGLVSRFAALRLEHDYHVEPTQLILTPTDMGYAGRKGRTPDILRTLDRQLARMKEDKNSLYHAATGKWFGGDAPSGLPGWLKPYLLIGAGVFIFLVLVTFLLRFQVRTKTYELLLKNRELRQEVNDRKQAEERLLEAVASAERERARSESFLAAIGDGVSILDRERRVIYQNDRHRALFGEHSGEHCYSAYAMSMDFCDGCPMKETFRSGEVLSLEKDMSREGEQVYFDITTSPIYNDKGEIVAGIEIVRDITARRIAEATIRSIVEGTAGKTGDDFFFSLVRQLATALRYRYAIVGEIVLPEKDRVHTLAVWNGNDFSDNFTYDLQVGPCNMPSGASAAVYSERVSKLFPQCLHLHAMQAESYLGVPLFRSTGERIGILSVIDDRPHPEQAENLDVLKVFAARAAAEIERKIGEQEKGNLQVQLIHSQRLESIGRLAGGVAHDFNNLLSTILGYSQLILRKMPAGESLREDIQNIAEAGKKAANLTRQLLAFSRKQILEMTVVNVNDIIEGIAKMLRRLIGEDINLELRLERGTGVILGDSGQIEQVFMNLAVNSRDAMPNGGTLVIETERVEVRHDVMPKHETVRPGHYILITVADTGQGMSQEVLDRVFEPFFTTKGVGKGTGLGLATVYGIVTQHNGYIFVTSIEGKGTTFSIYFPITGETKRKEDPPVVEEVRGGRESIMVVEDDPSVRNLVADTLRPLGYSLLVAANGVEALRLCAEHEGERIDALLSDVIMPGMNGFELGEAFIKKHPHARIVFMSGYMERIEELEKKLSVPYYLIMKPVTPLILAAKLREALDSKSDEGEGDAGMGR